jgi:hypothetical protein
MVENPLRTHYRAPKAPRSHQVSNSGGHIRVLGAISRYLHGSFEFKLRIGIPDSVYSTLGYTPKVNEIEEILVDY